MKDGALVDETAHVGGPRSAEPSNPTKADSDSPQTAPAEPLAAAPGLAAESGPQRNPATPQPLTAFPAAGEAELAGAAPAETTAPPGGEYGLAEAVAPAGLPADPALRREEVCEEVPQLQRDAASATLVPAGALTEPVRHEPLPPEPRPVAAGVPEIRVQQATQAAPTGAARTKSMPAAPAPRDAAPPLTPTWLLRPLLATDAARERLPDLGRAVQYLRLALRGVAILAVGLVMTVLILVVLYRWVNPPLSTLMLSQSLAGTEIERRWVPLRRVSPHLIKAVVLSEDGGFCRHRGVDWPAIGEALETDRGGSTITMQVVKNLFLWPSRSYVRKVIEIGLAYLVEALWSKQRILEIYLNVAEWGDGVFGAEAAARMHFNKPASRLTEEEAALLAVALPNPLERMPGAPSFTSGRLASRLLVRMRTSRADFSCVPLPRAAPGKAPLVPGPRLTL